jgi:hypothetical protein
MVETKVVTCKICNKTGMKRLGFHVRKKHNLSMKAYDVWKSAEEARQDVAHIREVTFKTVWGFLRKIMNRFRANQVCQTQK